MGGFSQKILQAIAQAERDFAQQQGLGIERSREKRAVSQDELNRQATLAQLLGKTKTGGQVQVSGQQVDIPGLEAQAEIETTAAQKKAEATTRGQFNVQLEFADKLNERAITQVKQKLEAVGIKSDHPEYNRLLSKQLGIPEEIEVEMNGQKVKISVKDAVDLQQKKLDYDRAIAVADKSAAARIRAAEIGAESREKIATSRLPQKAKDSIAKLDTALEVMQKIESTVQDKFVGGLLTGGKELLGRVRTMTGTATPEEAEFRTLVTQTLNEEISRLSGAAVSAQEFIRMKQGLPNLGMSPVEFRAAVKNTMERLQSLKKNILKQYGQTEEKIPEYDEDGNPVP